METAGSVPFSPPVAPGAPVASTLSTATQIEQIVYLASLASKPSDIDPILEPMRLITAKLLPGEMPSPTDSAQLRTVQTQLQQYLVEREPLRRFTIEGLQQKLAQNARGGAGAPNVTAPVLSWLGFTLALATLPYVVFTGISEELKQTAGAISLLTGLCVAAAWFFITSIRDFTAELRAAYRLIAIGVVIFGFGMMLQPIRTFLGNADLAWRHLELIIAPFFLSHFPIYAAMRGFAKQLGLQTRLTSPWVLAGAMALGSTVVVVLPHVPTAAQEFYFNLSVVTLVCCAAISGIGASIMFLIARHIGDLYRGPMRWLMAGYVSISLAVWEFLVIRFTVGYLPAGAIQVVSFMPTLLGGILLFVAAVKFKRASMY